MKNAVVILAAGSGKRFMDESSYKKIEKVRQFVPKQFLKLCGKSVFLWSVETFSSIKSFKQIVVVVPANMAAALSLKYKSRFTCIAGGDERFNSVKKGLALIKKDIDFVAIHDAARPLISREDILSVLKEAQKTNAAIAVEKAKDTIKFVTSENHILKTFNRAFVRHAQTPQIFSKELLIKAYSKKISVNTTDDSQLIENLKIKVSAVETKFLNFKITTQKDFELASALINRKSKTKT